MWGLFVGIGLGVLLYMHTAKFAEAMTRQDGKNTAWLTVLTVFKYVIIIGVLVLMTMVSVTHILWCAGGMVATSMGLSIIKFYKSRNGQK